MRPILEALPPLRAAFVGLSVLTVLGYGLKDSGVAVPGMMVSVFLVAIVYIDATVQDREPGPPGIGTRREPADETSTAPVAKTVRT